MRCEHSRIKKLIVYTLFACISLFCLAGSASAFVLGPTNYPQYGSAGKWGELGNGTAGGTVTWSLMDTGVKKSSAETFTALADFMTFDYRTVINASFDAWSSVADIQFVEVTDGGEAFGALTADSADIRIGGHAFDGSGGALAHAYFPPGWGGVTGDIHVDTGDKWKDQDSGSGYNLSRVLTHEIGHSIGLDHEKSLTALMNPYYTESTPLGLYADDIAGVRYLYGASLVTDATTSDSTLSYTNMLLGSAPVPEPATIALFGIGLAGLAGSAASRKWKKRNVNKT